MAYPGDHPGDYPGVDVDDDFSLSFSAGASLAVALADISVDPITIAFSAGASLTVGTPLDVDLIGFDFTAGANLDITVPREHTIDPVTGLPQYRLEVVEPDGTVARELANVAIGDIVEELGGDGSLDFTINRYDTAAALVTPTLGSPPPEVRVWRGPNLEAWQRVDGNRDTASAKDVDCVGLMAYFKDRVIGKAPKRNLLLNGNFTDNLAHWSGSYLTGSIPAAPARASVVTVDFYGEQRKAIQITGSDTVSMAKKVVDSAAVFEPNQPFLGFPLDSGFLPGGEAEITAAAEDIPDGTAFIRIEGHTANDGTGDGMALSERRALAAEPLVEAVHPDATITTVGRGYYRPAASNATEAGRRQNRRVELHYSTTVTAAAEHRQYYGQDIAVTNTTGRTLTIEVDGYFRILDFKGVSADGYGVQAVLVKASAPTVEVSESHTTIDETTPVNEWIATDGVSVEIPSDGIAYIVKVRYFPPEGVIQWTELGAFPDDALFFPTGTDQALIAKGIVEHVQDAAMGKLGDWPILIGTRTPLTGVTRRREYPYHERRIAATCLDELAALNDGIEQWIEFDDTTRTFVTGLRRGQVTTVTLELGVNVVAYDAPVDVKSAATRVYVQGLDQSGANRREGVYTDLSGLGGLLVERVEYAKPETPVTELDEYATSYVARYGHPATLLEVTIGRVASGPGAHSALVSSLLDRARVGDTVEVVIVDAQTSIIGPHRIIRKTLTPETDGLRYSLAPEV